MPAQRIRILSADKKFELVFFLDQTDESKVHNTIVKFNIEVKVCDPKAFLEDKFCFATFCPTVVGYEFHGDRNTGLTLANIKNDASKKLIKDHCPVDYEFHELGVAFNKTVDDKGKYGNIEIKYRPIGAIVTADENPDGLININIHLKHTRKKGLPMLKTVLSPFTKEMQQKAKAHLTSITLENFKSKHFSFALKDSDSPNNLKRYQNAVTLKAEQAALAATLLANAAPAAPAPAPGI